MKHETYLSTAITAAKKAGFFIKESYRGEYRSSYKDPHNIVTEVDIGAENIILDILQKAFPDHSFFSEERGMINNHSKYLWIIDPLDGTTNFTHHFPHFCISIGLAHLNEPSLGVVYHPIRDELFSASRGKGATRNGTRLRVTSQKTLEKAVVLINRGSERKEKLRHGAIVNLMTHHLRSIRIFGATAVDLCYVASGTFDALLVNGCRFYDCAAGNLIAEESGALVTDFSGKPWKPDEKKTRDILVANPLLHKKLLTILKNA